MGVIDVYLSASIKVTRRAEDGKDAVSYEILLDTDSVVLKSDTKQFETHKLGDVHFMYHQGSYMEDMTMRIIDTYSYIILYYGYEAKKDENGKPVLGSDGKPVMEYKAITYSSNEGVTDIWGTMQMNVGDDAECYGMKYIWYDKNLPDSDEAMFEKIWSKLDGIPPKELDIKILATKMFTVRREADSVQSSDVVFAVGDNKTTAPTTGWITNFSGLTLADGKYVWTCTKTTLTNGTSYYTGAYCLGECYDFAHVDELYALGSSATKSPDIDSSLGVNIWQSSYTPKKGMYLWTCVRVTYNSNNIPYYLNKKCVSYFPTDGTNGTSFTPKGMADGYYRKATEIPAYSDEQNGKIYLVDDATNVTSPFIVPDAPYVAQYVLHNGEYVLYLVHAEFGDGYNVNGHLYVANDDKWVYLGEIQGEKGEQGDPGIDAINIVFSPAELVFDADENGNLIQAEKSAEIKVYRGTTELQYKTDWDNDAEIGDNCWAALLFNTTTNKPEVKISGITSSNIDDVKVPATSGGANVSVIVDGVKYRAYLPFSVNVNTYANFLIRDNKKYISKYTEVSNKYNTISNELNGKASKDELMEVSSSIEQTARRISLEVSSNVVGRRNLLVNSDFHNQEGVYFHPGTRIECTTGKDNINCIHANGIYSGSGEGDYIGAYWDGSNRSLLCRSVKIQKGKKYVASCWAKCDNTDATLCIECYFTDKQQGATRLDTYFREIFRVNKVDAWELHTLVIDTTNAPSEYIAVYFWMNPRNAGTGKEINAYFCKPMFEQSEQYSGWSLSTEDYDYVGGNMLDNTLSLDKSGTLYEVNGTLTTAGFGESTSIYKSFVYKLKGIVDSFSQLPTYGNVYNDTYYVRNEGTCYAYNGSNFENVGNDYYYNILEWRKGKSGEFSPFGLEANKDYVFSFMAKGTGKITAYFHEPYTDVFVESSLGAIYTEVNGYADFQLTNEWRRYWVHWRPSDSLHKYILLRLNRSFNSDGSAPITDCYIAQPKLEDGATMTEFTERKTDLVDKASLKKAGIGITDREVLLYGEKVKVMNGNAVAALFKDGMLNADLIAAKVLESLGSNGARVSISDGIMEFFGSVNKTKPNIRFGLNSEGSAVLSYYDNNGDLLYDLGPHGISTMDKTNGSFTAYQFYTSKNLFGVSSTPSSYGTYKTFTSSRNSISETFLVADDSYDSHLFPSFNPSTNTKTTLYRYKAPRINGKIVADSLNGFTTQELASKADGKYFTSKAKADVVKNGNLASLAPDGDYWNVNAGVVNQGNLMPAILKPGESYNKPTYSRALPMSLFAGSTELGIVGKICSKETTLYWGQEIQG